MTASEDLWTAIVLATSDFSLPLPDQTAEIGRVEVALDAGGDPDHRLETGWVPLHAAAFCGHLALVELLLERGASPDAVLDVAGSTPENFSLFYGHTESARALDDRGRHPDDLRTAAGVGDVAAVVGWFDGADLRPGADRGMPFTAPLAAFPPRTEAPTARVVVDEALTWASRNGQLAVMEELVDRGADVNANPYRGTPLLWAAFSDHAPAATWLLDHGADPDLAHDFGGADHGHGATALHLAAQFGSATVLEVLLARGADPTVTDAEHGATPAGWAEHGDQPALAARLRAAGG